MTQGFPGPSSGEGATFGAAPRPAPTLNGSAKSGASTASMQEPRLTRSVLTPGPDSAEMTRRVSRVAAGAAHDLVNLLVTIDINMDLLASESLSEEGADAVRSVRAETSYLRNLAGELRMAAAESGVRANDRQTSLAAWWPDMGVLLEAVHGDDIMVRVDIPRGLPDVCIKPHHLTQVVLNLVGNAAHAIADRASGERGPGGPAEGPRRGEVELSARPARNGRAVTLTVADNGVGMGPAVLARAFEPFYTTRAGRGGTGLGLAMVQQLVADVGGRVRLTSVVGAGTTVTIELPTCDESEPSLQRARTS
jgi:signal transduction histidine kinase